MSSDTDWYAVLLDGSVGAFVSVFAALYIVRRQLRSDRALAIEERQLRAAIDLNALLQTHIDKMRRLRELNALTTPDRRDRALDLDFQSDIFDGFMLAKMISEPFAQQYNSLAQTTYVVVGLIYDDVWEARMERAMELATLERANVQMAATRVVSSTSAIDPRPEVQIRSMGKVRAWWFRRRHATALRHRG